MNGIAGSLMWLMNQVGFAVCHQFHTRSLAYAGHKLPVCARDTGLFLCFALCTAALFVVYGRTGKSYPSWKRIVPLLLLLLPAVVDAVTSYAGVRGTDNATRLITGALAGAGAAGLFFPLLSRQLFPEGAGDVVFGKWWVLSVPVALAAAVCLALWPRWPGAYWVWAPLVCLSIVFTVLALNFTLISLIAEWLRDSAPGLSPAVVTIALLMTAGEIVLANRLHWLLAGALSALAG